jgi:hypothetical protein
LEELNYTISVAACQETLQLSVIFYQTSKTETEATYWTNLLNMKPT